MNVTGFRDRIPVINSWLLAGVFFSIPLTVAPAYWLSALILILWLLEGRYAAKLRVLAAEPLVWVCAAYYAVFALSLLWTEDLEWGVGMLSRQNFFLLFALYFSVARREHFDRYLSAFLLSIALCQVLAYYNWVQINFLPELPEGIRVDKNPEDTAPFVDRIMYAPVLALAGYVAGYRLLFQARSPRQRLLYAVLLATTSINLVFSGGRAGLVGFLVLVALLIVQRFARRPLVAAALAASMVSGVLLAGYFGNSYFQGRFDDAVDQVMHYEDRPNSSVGLRIVFAINATRIFIQNPVLGVGLGDYPTEYDKTNALHTPEWKTAWNPHNHYLYVLTATGVLGGSILLMLLLLPLLRHNPPDGRQFIRAAPPVLIMTISLFESYLMRSNISLMFAVFLAVLWCGIREPEA
ncbi:O-antigen ligase [Methyloversatilis sp.]|uniref:O-antigen ligase family protein n=1 Tax=Methyloversatilis sp. TaxID=2569862 RepID=UPI0027371517|nr:O-antigen ligase family protein [Methyloversatilis sp.]MDP2868935.1 O-antigen ligase family protein [Methyloversatilis sp.]MDP3288048.1 O-antigen ligase family protein [Methyloversatilis sp.]MDP3454634.1 O-antigen ligase family protein [Methyloversatilis sp.]MDP3580156.1 O-antigen ligase family protein [Methyloversatilis sp.]